MKFRKIIVFVRSRKEGRDDDNLEQFDISLYDLQRSLWSFCSLNLDTNVLGFDGMMCAL